MRLLNATDFVLHEFLDDYAPPYAILSHTWGSDEVTFQDITGPDPPVNKAGFAKIKGCCKHALARRLKWVWVDTCCIDKSSSAEIGEAINSMYRWYARSAVCFAYLSDYSNKEDFDAKAFQKCRWFTRGWTLQELIAPEYISFFDCHWEYIGSHKSLLSDISEATRINEAVLSKHSSPSGVSVAERMSWASRRKTTRVEDLAYCLLGLFSINMPLIYGEGNRAFRRLQEEIIRQSEDRSIFMWQSRQLSVQSKVYPIELRGVLAEYPREFAEVGHLIPMRDYAPKDFAHAEKITRMVDIINTATEEPYWVTNRGLRMKVLLVDRESGVYTAIFMLDFLSKELCFLGIDLRKVHRDEYYRVSAWNLRLVSFEDLVDAKPATIFIKTHLEDNSGKLFSGASYFFIAPVNNWRFTIFPAEAQITPVIVGNLHRARYSTAAVCFPDDDLNFVVLLGFNTETGLPLCGVAQKDANMSLDDIVSSDQPMHPDKTEKKVGDLVVTVQLTPSPYGANEIQVRVAAKSRDSE